MVWMQREREGRVLESSALQFEMTCIKKLNQNMWL